MVPDSLRKPHLVFGVFAAIATVAGWRVFESLVELSRRDPTASHVVLVPVLSIALIWHRRRIVFRSIEPDVPAGISVIAVAGVLAWLAGERWSGMSATPSFSLGVAALVALWMGGFLLAYGRTAFHAARFPLLFLAGMIPMPSQVIDAATAYLKLGSAYVVAALFTLAGTPYHQDRFVFALPSFSIEIADACSGIRSSIALVLTSLLVGHLLLRSRWTKVLLVLAVVPLAVLKNGIRIVTLSLLAMHLDPRFLAGRLHHEGGIVFYLLTLALLLPVLEILRRYERAGDLAIRVRSTRRDMDRLPVAVRGCVRSAPEVRNCR